METFDWKSISVVVTVFLAWSGLLAGVIKILIERAIRGNDKRFERIESDLEDESAGNGNGNFGSCWRICHKNMFSARTGTGW